MKIGQKIAGAIGGVTLVALAAMLVLNKWSFDQGFLDYLNDQEQARIDRMALDLAQVYVVNGGWEPLPRHRLIEDIRRSGERGPLPHPPDHHRQPNPEGALHPPPRRGRGGPPPPGIPETELRDTSGQVLVGHVPASGALLRAEIVVQEESVGELVTLVKTKVRNNDEAAFASSQFQISIFTALLLFALALIVAVFLSRTLTKPIHQARAFVRGLAGGEYDRELASPTRDEVGALINNLNQLATALASNRYARRRWMSDISHELRTPIASLRAELDAMLDGVRPIDTAGLESLSQELDRMNRLVDDLHQLSLADLGSLEYVFVDTDLEAAVDAAVSSVQLPEGLSTEVIVEPILVRADESRLHQLLTNLLTNSIRYTSLPGKIVISSKRKGDRVEVCIEDSSPGVSAAERERLLEPLYRVDHSRSRDFGGSGLGLAIASTIAKAHGGELALDSSPLGGLSVRFTLAPIK